LRFDQCTRIGTEVAELVYFDPGFEAVDTFDVGEWISVALEEPKAEEFVIKAVWKF
jgi:hypothetical protein